jgi:hypothetical protein
VRGPHGEVGIYAVMLNRLLACGPGMRHRLGPGRSVEGGPTAVAEVSRVATTDDSAGARLAGAPAPEPFCWVGVPLLDLAWASWGRDAIAGGTIKDVYAGRSSGARGSGTTPGVVIGRLRSASNAIP